MGISDRCEYSLSVGLKPYENWGIITVLNSTTVKEGLKYLMSNSSKPIGFFDSGVGGVSVLKEAVKLLPNENFIYYGDNANAPYGTKTEQEIQDLSLACGDFLISKGVKAIVMACNTATSVAVRQMREQYSIPVISIEPAVKPAMETSYDGDIIVLATEGTLAQPRYNLLLERLHATERVINVQCKGLVTLIEKGKINSKEMDEYIRCIFAPYSSHRVDTVVLGCTHYSFVKNKIKQFLYENFHGNRHVIDGNGGTVRQLKRVLEEKGLLTASTKKGKITFFSSGDRKFIRLMKRLYQMNID